MATTTPLSKRQRANIARSTLRKPFVSPLKPGSRGPTAFQTPIRVPVVSSSPPTSSAPDASTPPTASAPSPPSSSSAYTPLKPTPTPHHHHRRSALSLSRPRPKFNSPATASTSSSDPELLALHHRRSELEKEISSTLAAIETCSTARKYEVKNEDTRLEELVTKFRRAGQSAADHMFGLMNDRVNRMGGTSAYLSKIRPNPSSWSHFSSDFEPECPEGMDEKEWHYMLEERKKEMEEQREEHEEVEVDKYDEPEDGGFTMGMMLRQMGIPQEMIGWDKESGTWVV
ncbi:hypothetical protein SAICODRAFT_28822 [Saitoella complicata NRRL Y-17804]|nr:uncharacterized protein SAICODRAFT_28822 [Saitoella complicata NRRL Y-17804]ODQ55795.1 hypothetical protein SAICODRAFT_28822 [Saitoella complicata NRRL Y-17804]